MIYDCVSFFNELDLLEIRLNVLKDVVDKFVIVEATQTHTGNPKPLYFADNKGRFAAFANRIVHVVVDEFPVAPVGYTDRQASWMRENFQRNAMMRGLTEAKPDDLILISDLDEIPRPESVREALRYRSGVTALGLEVFCYYLNVKNYTHYEITCTRALRYSTLVDVRTYDKMPPNPNWDPVVNVGATTTNARYMKPTRVLKRAGWHFSYLGGAAAIVRKIGSIAVEYANEHTSDEKWIADVIERGEDITGCGGRYFIVPLDGRFPKYVIQNADRYSALVLQADEGYYRRTRIERCRCALRGWIRKNGAKLIPRCCKQFLYEKVYCKLVKDPISI